MLHFKPHIVEVLCLAYLDFILGYNVASIFTNLCYYNFNPKANVCVNGKILKKKYFSAAAQCHIHQTCLLPFLGMEKYTEMFTINVLSIKRALHF